MLGLQQKYKDLENWGFPYYAHYSTSLSPYKEGFITGYERCCIFATDDTFRKDLNRSLLISALGAFFGGYLIGPTLVPALALNLAKVYLLPQGLDYLGAYLAQHAESIRSLEPERAAGFDLYSGFIKSISDTILISGLAATLAAPIVGVLSHVQFKMAYDILVPTANAVIRTIGFELTKAKDVAFDREVKGAASSEYMLKALLTGVSYKFMTSMVGTSLLPDMLAFVAARGFTEAFIAAEKDITAVPKKMWENLNVSVGTCAQYFLWGAADMLILAACGSSTALSAVALRSVSMKLSEEPIASIKAYYKGIHESIESFYKDIEPKAKEIIGQVYGHASKVAQQVLERAESTFRQP